MIGHISSGLQFVFEGPLNDFANTVFDVLKDTTNNKVMEKLDENTQKDPDANHGFLFFEKV